VTELDVSASHIAVVGSLNADLVVRVGRFPRPGETLTGNGFARFPGGKGANQAYAAARLGGSVRMVGSVGDDDLGRWLVEHLQRAGIDTTAVSAHQTAGTGLALITIDATGQNTIVLVPGANAALGDAHLELASAALRGAAVLLLQLEVPLTTVEAAARRAREAGALVILDPAPAQPIPATLMGLVDCLTPNESELAELTGGGTIEGEDDLVRRARLLLQQGARRVIVKWGAYGAVLVDTRVHRWPAHRVSAVDTTAAGDAFNGALAAALCDGRMFEDAGAFATAAAAISVTRHGAQPGMPERHEVDALLRSGA
jgi:ribokinase